MRLKDFFVVASVFAFHAACSFTTDLGPLQDGVCSSGEKACNSECVDQKSPSTGCGLRTCAPCALPSVAIHICGVDGACAIAQCQPTFADCDGNPANGCEAHINFDTLNCNGCGIKCNLANANPSCTGGTCTVASCNPGWADCDGKPGNGCEENLTNDPANCGACGTTCPAGQQCISSQCR